MSDDNYDAGRLRRDDMIRVAIVDDHPIARRGVAQILAEDGRFEVVAAAASPGELAGLRTADLAGGGVPADVIILDLYLHSETPCLPAVAELAASTKVLVMSASGRREDVLGAMQAGAAGYVTKHARPEMFVAAVETVAAGGFALSPQLADVLQAALHGPSELPAETRRPSVTPLSAREEQTLDLIARGFTHGQVATRMGISKATVGTYVERIRTKLQVGNKAELTRAALERSRRAQPM
ncbi:LuxR C-terminal-related transcriptional regulator [Dactylosporangium sp. CA-092794]|uniref:LuxR C-terminal-related transcriptional regulator n=1 Tax=Dactylosporangium sp. CA-092794 TaxID=3239929 RepID=UPI003D8DB96C